MPSTARPLLERFNEDYDILENGCWEWRLSRWRGYGQIGVPTGRSGSRTRQAHRVAYELFIGPIPEELTLDHLCRNKGCVNPEHLEPVTIGENVRRALDIPRRNPQRDKTHCPAGHSYSGDNLRITKDGRRRCRKCVKRLNREQYLKRTGRQSEAGAHP